MVKPMHIIRKKPYAIILFLLVLMGAGTLYFVKDHSKNELEIKALKSQLKQMDGSLHRERLQILKQLLPLEPSNRYLRTQISLLEKQLEQIDADEGWRVARQLALKEYKKKKQIAKEIRGVSKYGLKPKKNPLNGSVKPVISYLKFNSPYPESFSFNEWSEVVYEEDYGWVVTCAYLEKDVFSVQRLHKKRFVIQHNIVVNETPVL
jgi:hypothetical protein